MYFENFDEHLQIFIDTNPSLPSLPPPLPPRSPGTSQSLSLIFIWQKCSKLTIYMQNYDTDPYIKKTERIQRWNKKEYQNLFVSFTEGPVPLTGL